MERKCVALQSPRFSGEQGAGALASKLKGEGQGGRAHPGREGSDGHGAVGEAKPMPVLVELGTSTPLVRSPSKPSHPVPASRKRDGPNLAGQACRLRHEAPSPAAPVWGSLSQGRKASAGEVRGLRPGDGAVGRDRDTWESQASSGRISARGPAVLRCAGAAMKIFASHLGKFTRNPEKSRGVFFLFLIRMFPLAFKTN